MKKDKLGVHTVEDVEVSLGFRKYPHKSRRRTPAPALATSEDAEGREGERAELSTRSDSHECTLLLDTEQTAAVDQRQPEVDALRK